MSLTHKKYCRLCSRSFHTRIHNQAFCSKPCRNEYNRVPNDELPISGKYKLRFEVFRRDGFRCVYCGRSARKHSVVLETDHIIPTSKGGSNNLENLVTACYDCNIGKSDTLLLEPIP